MAQKGRAPTIEGSPRGKEIEKEKPTMAIKELIEKAKSTLADLTGFKNPRGIGAKKQGQEWRVRVEITEKSSIPEAMDVLGIYDVYLDNKGNILNYERKGLKKRGDTETKFEEETE